MILFLESPCPSVNWPHPVKQIGLNFLGSFLCVLDSHQSLHCRRWTGRWWWSPLCWSKPEGPSTKSRLLVENILQVVMEARSHRLLRAPVFSAREANIAESSQLAPSSPWQTMVLPVTGQGKTSGWHRIIKRDLNRASPWTLAAQ